eukprot:389504_1
MHVSVSAHLFLNLFAPSFLSSPCACACAMHTTLIFGGGTLWYPLLSVPFILAFTTFTAFILLFGALIAAIGLFDDMDPSPINSVCSICFVVWLYCSYNAYNPQ